MFGSEITTPSKVEPKKILESITEIFTKMVEVVFSYGEEVFTPIGIKRGQYIDHQRTKVIKSITSKEAPTDEELSRKIISELEKITNTLIQQVYDFARQKTTKKVTEQVDALSLDIIAFQSLIAWKKIELALMKYLPDFDSDKSAEEILALFYEFKGEISQAGLWDTTKPKLLESIKVTLQTFMDLIYIRVNAYCSANIHDETLINKVRAGAGATRGDDELPELTVSPHKTIAKIQNIEAGHSVGEEPLYFSKDAATRHRPSIAFSAAADPAFGEGASIAASRISSFRSKAEISDKAHKFAEELDKKNQELSDKSSTYEDFGVEALAKRRVAKNLSKEINKCLASEPKSNKEARQIINNIVEMADKLEAFKGALNESQKNGQSFLNEQTEWYEKFYGICKEAKLTYAEQNILESRKEQFSELIDKLELQTESLDEWAKDHEEICSKIQIALEELKAKYAIMSLPEAAAEVVAPAGVIDDTYAGTALTSEAPVEVVADAIAADEMKETVALVGASEETPAEMLVSSEASDESVAADEVTSFTADEAIKERARGEIINKANGYESGTSSAIMLLSRQMTIDLDFRRLASRLNDIRASTGGAVETSPAKAPVATSVSGDAASHHDSMPANAGAGAAPEHLSSRGVSTTLAVPSDESHTSRLDRIRASVGALEFCPAIAPVTTSASGDASSHHDSLPANAGAEAAPTVSSDEPRTSTAVPSRTSPLAKPSDHNAFVTPMPAKRTKALTAEIDGIVAALPMVKGHGKETSYEVEAAGPEPEGISQLELSLSGSRAMADLAPKAAKPTAKAVPISPSALAFAPEQNNSHSINTGKTPEAKPVSQAKEDSRSVAAVEEVDSTGSGWCSCFSKKPTPRKDSVTTPLLPK